MAESRHVFAVEQAGSHVRPGVGVILTLEGWDASKLVLTSLRGASDVNYQVNYALNDDAHILVFGERLTVLDISGVAVMPGPSKCPSVTPRDFIKFYKNNRMDSDSQPLKMAFGGAAVKGYFISMATELAGGQDFSFRFNFKFLGKWQW